MDRDEAVAAAALRLSRAFRFAAERHVHQRRKGDAAEPYLNHLAEVADLVAEATGGGDVDLIVAALLHDVIEGGPTFCAASRVRASRPWPSGCRFR